MTYFQTSGAITGFYPPESSTASVGASDNPIVKREIEEVIEWNKRTNYNNSQIDKNFVAGSLTTTASDGTRIEWEDYITNSEEGDVIRTERPTYWFSVVDPTIDRSSVPRKVAKNYIKSIAKISNGGINLLPIDITVSISEIKEIVVPLINSYKTGKMKREVQLYYRLGTITFNSDSIVLHNVTLVGHAAGVVLTWLDHFSRYLG